MPWIPLIAFAAATREAGAGPSATTDGSKGAAFDLARQVVAGGGGSSTGGAFGIRGTIGQADVDPLHPATGGPFALSGGFWPGISTAPPPEDPVFASGFEPVGP